MNEILWLTAALSLFTTVMIVCYHRYRTKKTLDTIEKMLDSVLNGSFSENAFDESRLSRLETRFAHYLSASVVSARNMYGRKRPNQIFNRGYFPSDQNAHCQPSSLHRAS